MGRRKVGASPEAAVTYDEVVIIDPETGAPASLSGGGGGSGTEYTEDAAAAANPVGGALILVRRDTLTAAEVSADGDNVAAKATSKGELRTSDADVLAELVSAHKAEDAAHSSGDKGIMSLAVRRDTAASGAGADGDYATFNVDSSGQLWVRIGAMAALPAGTNNIGDVDIASIAAGSNIIGNVRIDQTTPGTTNGVVPAGNVAHDAADSGSPVKIGGKAHTAAPGAVADGDRVNQAFTLQGAAHVSVRRNDGTIVDPDAPVAVDSGVRYVEVTLSTDTSAYAAGEVIADTQIVSTAMRQNDAQGLLQSITVIDQDDQKAALYIYLLSANVSMGTENSAPSISDANALEILGPPIFIPSGAYDASTNPNGYYDLGGASIAGRDGVGKAVKPATGTDDLYVAVVNGSGTPTYSATGLKLRLGFLI